MEGLFQLRQAHSIRPQPRSTATRARKVTSNCLLYTSYTGFTWEQVLQMREKDDAVRALLDQVDVLVDGPFIQSQRSLELHFRGSSNQHLIDVQKSLEADIDHPILWE